MSAEIIRVEPVKEKNRVGVRIASKLFGMEMFYNTEGLDEEQRKKVEKALTILAGTLQFVLGMLDAVSRALLLSEVLEGERGEEET